MNSLRLAFGLFTAIPVGRLPEVSPRSSGRAMLLAPLTVLPMLAVLGAGHALILKASAPSLVVAAAALVVETLLTRGMHLDGLADTADGLSAGYDAATSLRAMKASDIGPSGVAAVVLALLLQAACLTALLPTTPGTVLAGVCWVVSRHALAWACLRGVPAAQPTGLGAMVAGSVGPAGAAASLAIVVAGSTAATVVSEGAAWLPLVAVTAGDLSVLALVGRARTRLGGVTGDVLGAVVEVSLCAALLCASLFLGLGSA